MHFIKQGRRLLNFINNHLNPGERNARPLLGLDFLAQVLGVSHIAPVFIRLEQINPPGLRITLPQQSGLAGLARPPKKEAFLTRRREFELALEHARRIT